MKRLYLSLLCVAWMSAAPAANQQAPAAAPTPQDFAWGIRLESEAGRPMLELTLPESVYAGATRSDLGDLRVFNAEGQVVPHALCLSPRAVPARVETSQLPLFPLHAGVAPRDALGTQVRVETSAGTRVEVLEPGASTTTAAPQPTPVRAWIVDARGLPDPMQALRLHWHSTADTSEASVRVLASNDLDHWSTLKDDATLLRAENDEQTLERSRIPLSEGRRDYLRIEPVDGSAGFVLDGVTAERIVREERLPTRWTQIAPAEAPPKSEPGDLYFRSDYQAPMEMLRIELPASNMSLSVALSSRANDRAAWLGRWSGEVYLVRVDGHDWTTPAAYFATTSDRQWRLHVLRGAETLAGRSPTIYLGYTPARLRFLAQGSGPYLLAYGSGRVSGPPSNCDSLLTGVGAADIERMIGQAQTLPAEPLAGSGVLKPLPKPTPTRLIVLWVVLIGGALLLVGMALSLLKKIRQD